MRKDGDVERLDELSLKVVVDPLRRELAAPHVKLPAEVLGGDPLVTVALVRLRLPAVEIHLVR